MEVINAKKMATGSEEKGETSSEDIIEKSETFTESGNCDDEVTLIFAGDKKLYVSKNFLRYASPVFEAMFNHDWIEGKENCVGLKGKNYNHFLEFLLCIHPRVFRPITEKNVLQIASIAEEYQVTTIIRKCQDHMLHCLRASLQESKSKGRHYLHHVEYLRFCIRILVTAHVLCYSSVVNTAIKTVAKFGHILYNKGQVINSSISYYAPSLKTMIGKETLEDIQKNCMDLYNKLPLELRYQILSERLLLMTDIELKV